MKTLILASLGLGLLSFTPRSDAGVALDLRFGSGDRYHHEREHVVYERHEYRRPVFVEPRGVVVVQEPVYVSACPQVPCDNFYATGRDWARDLRDDAVTRDQFIVFLRSHIVRTSTYNYEEFRRGFIEGYGIHGERAFDMAFRDARAC